MVNPIPLHGAAEKKQPSAAKPASQPDPNDNLGVAVGHNLKRLRTKRGLSLERLAKNSGVSRAMLGQIEQGRSVPTINVVWKIAQAFDVPFSALIAARDDAKVHVIPATDSKLLTSASGEFTSRALFPFDADRKTEFYELRLKPRGAENADAHAPGTQENLVVAQGAVEIELGGARHRLGPGDAILFQAGLPHAYINLSEQEAILYLVMNYLDPLR